LADLLPPLIEGTEYRRDEFVRILSESAPDDARRLVEETLAKIVAGILQSSPDRLDRSRPLNDVGMDSLMTVELLATTSDQFQCDIPLAELVNSTLTIEAVAQLILIRLDVQSSPTTPEAMIVTARDLDSIPAGER
jgi:acyl carrier protein